jgi:hypothetical protein
MAIYRVLSGGMTQYDSCFNRIIVTNLLRIKCRGIRTEGELFRRLL